MSYEGYEELLCANGHRWTEPAGYAYGYADFECPTCQGEAVWSNSVDQTNCDDVGTIPEWEWKKFLVSPAQTEICKCCGHLRVFAPPVYRIPTKEETYRARHYLENGVLVPLSSLSP